MTNDENKTGYLGPWAPLRHGVYRMIWIATLFSNVGSWMHDVGAGWLMTSLAPTPLMVALVQAATTAPMFLLALPAGALADIVDRRRYLITTQFWMMLSAALLGVITLMGHVTAPLLLALTFSVGVGAAMMLPAWGAMVPELVPRVELQAAIGLNTIAMNAARAIGPAIAGLIIAASGPGMVFLINAASFLFVIGALFKWKRLPKQSALPGERLLKAVRAGFRYARHSPELRAVMAREAAFFLFASASWALLPLIVRQELDSGPGIYGLFLACVGIGAIGGALAQPRLYRRISRDKIVAGATLLYAIAMLVLAHSGSVPIAAAAMLLIGFTWMTVVSSLLTAAQMALPAWVRARGLAFFWVVFTGGMAIGSAVWGQVATVASIPTALTIAACGAIAGIVATWRFHVSSHDTADRSPSIDWPSLEGHAGHAMDRGPVMVMLEYRIDPARKKEFAHAMHHMRAIRKRDGAYLWELFDDIDDPGRMVECFMVESWLEHLRQHERVTMADREVSRMTRAFHIGAEPPKVTHFLAAKR